MRSRYFAVGLKGWVQIIRSTKPPVATTTEAIVQSERRTLQWKPSPDNPYGNYVEKIVPVKRKLKQTTFEGGAVVKTLKSSRFSCLLKIGVREGAMIELMPEQVERLV